MRLNFRILKISKKTDLQIGTNFMNYLNLIMPYILAYIAIKGLILFALLSNCQNEEEDKDNSSDE